MQLASLGRGAEPTTQTASAGVQQAGAPSKASGGDLQATPTIWCVHFVMCRRMIVLHCAAVL